MNPQENKDKVIANDNDIKRQIPGITTTKEKSEKSNEVKNEELFFRATNK